MAKHRLFTTFVLCFLAGVLATSFFNIGFLLSWPALLLFALLLLLSAFCNFLLKNSILVISSFASLFFLFGLSYYSWFEYRHQPDLVFNQKVTLSGTIVSDPELRVTDQRFIFLVTDSACCENQRILLKIPRFPSYQYGDQLKIRGQIVQPSTDIEGFNYAAYLKKSLVFGYLNNPELVEKTGQNASLKTRSLKALYLIGQRFELALNRVLPEPHASLAAGILLGVKRNIPEDLLNNLSRTSLTHIIALSGLIETS